MANQIPRDLFKSDLDKALCLTSKVEKNDRYGDYKIIDKKLEVKLGTASDVIEESNVYVELLEFFKYIKSYPRHSLLLRRVIKFSAHRDRFVNW